MQSEQSLPLPRDPRRLALDDELVQAAYGDLRGLADVVLRDERAGHTLQATALANEVWLKLGRQGHARYGSHQHFLAVAARAMRQILVDHARKRAALCRGGDAIRVTLVEETARTAPTHNELDVLALEEALVRYEKLDPRGAEIIELRFFGGMTEAEVAKHLNLSRRTVAREWRLAKAWLAEALDE